VKPLASTLLSAAGLQPSADGDVPDVPGDSPLTLLGLAAFRRQTQQTLAGDEASALKVADPTQSSLMLAAVAANSAPSASPTVGLPETVNGVVRGSLNAVDAEGNPLTYTVQSQSAGSDVKVDGAGNFTYTPSVVQRLQAATTSGLDTDTFTVRVSDGQTFTDVPVTVVVRPGQLAAGTPVGVGSHPSGIAVNAVDGSRAYVTNQDGKSLSVIDTSTGAVLSTIALPSAPTAVVVSPVPNQNRAYVAMTSGIAVIDTASNTVVDLNTTTTTVDVIKVGSGPSALAINPTGTRLYVSNGSSNTVSVVDLTTNKEITKVTVGLQPSGLAVSPDGTRLYALNKSGDKLTVINTANNQVLGSTKVGNSPRYVVLSPNGQRIYVTNYGSGTVTVLNATAAAPVVSKTITVGTQPEGIAISKDGNLVYVANGKDTVSVIDTKTNTVMGSAVPIASLGTSGAHTIALSDNEILVTDYADNWLRVLNVARVQTAPQANGQPTVGTPDPNTGVVTGDLKVIDTDGDALSYNVTDAPNKGSLTVNPDGTYTYTPTPAARQAAGPNTVDQFTVRVSDTRSAYKDASVTVPIAPSTPTAPPEEGLTATITPIALGSGPDFLAANGSRVYILNVFEPTVAIVDTNTNTVIKTSPQLSAGGAMTLSPDGERLYVAEYMGNRVYVLDADTLELDGEPIDVRTTYGGTIAVSPDGTRLYVGSLNQDFYYDEYGNPHGGDYPAYVSVVDTATRDVVAEIPVSWSVGNVELSPNGQLLYVNSPDRVYVINTVTNTGITSFDVGGQPADVAFSEDSTQAYITNLQSGELYVIDTATNAVTAKPVIDTTDYRYNPEWDSWYEAGFPTDLAVSKGGRLYIARGDDIVVVDTATNSVLGEIRVATDIPNDGAQSLTIADNGTIYVTLEDTVVAVDVTPQQQTSFALSQPDSGARTMMATLAATNSAPTAAPLTNTPNQVTGAITGTVNGSDVDLNTLTYSVPPSGAGAPGKGTVSIDRNTGAFTYQPSTGARLAAQSTSGPDFDTFTVNVYDGQVSTPVMVTVAVLPATPTLSVADTAVALGSGSDPSAVAVYGNRTYVANATAGTVKVLNTDTNQVVASIPVQTSPAAVAVSPDGKSVWVANSGSKTVQRIESQSNTVVATVTVGTTPTALAVTGDSVWVANAGSNYVSRISTATNKVVATTTVGSAPSAIAVSGDQVYVANKNGNSISVISAATNRVVSTKSLGTAPNGLTVAGGKLYVTQQTLNRVLVLNSSTLAQVATISLGAVPTSITTSPDGSLAYVTTSNHRISVLNTQTNTVASTTVLSSAAGTGGHAVAVDSSATNGKVYISDAVDNSVRVLSLARGNTAPVATDKPTVDTLSNGDGAASGSVNVKDWDGDPLTYTVASQPASGSVTVTNGIYIFTPTSAAREQSAQTPATASFNAIASDGRGGTITVPVSNVPIQPLVINHAPTAPEFQYFDAIDPVTGEVRGRVIASDVDGDPLSYQLLWGPYGASSFTFNSATGDFSYIPSQEMRENATVYPENNYDTFRVTISDGTASVSPWVNMQVLSTNVAPSAYSAPEVPPADPATGRVSGSINVYDPNGDVVTYAISGGPSRGTATVDAAAGVYTYTPFGSERSAGGLDAFTVSATDGQDTSTFTVTVPVRVPELVSAQTQIPLPGAGTDIAVSGSRAYVFNRYLWTVSAIDTTTNTLIRTSQPLASGTTLNYPGNVVASPDGTRVFVANWVEGKIIELDPTTLAPVGQPIAVAGGGDDMVFSPDGSRLYVAHDGANAKLSIIDTTSRTVVGTIGTTPDTTDMAISSGGRTLYLADGYYNRIQVIDTSTNVVVAYIPLGPRSYNGDPGGIALSPDGKWAYVTNTENATVSVIDLTTRRVVGDPIVVGVPPWLASTTRPTAIAVSPDGSRVYVANGQDVVVIDAATRAVVGAVRFPGYMSDTSARASQAIAVDSNGDILAYGGSGLVSLSIGTSSSTMA